MSTYFSPTGNPEVWENKPDGYYTIEEWKELHPDPIPVLTFEEVKANKLLDLHYAFDAAVSGSFTTTEGYKMQFNTDDSLKMFGAINRLESKGIETGYITDADDVTHYDIPLSVMKSVQNQMLDKFAECHLKKQQYRALIENAESIEDLNKIDITF